MGSSASATIFARTSAHGATSSVSPRAAPHTALDVALAERLGPTTRSHAGPANQLDDAVCSGLVPVTVALAGRWRG